MKPREYMEAAFSFRQVHIVPYRFAAVPTVMERLDKYYGGQEWRRRIQHFSIGAGFPNTAFEIQVGDGLFQDEYGTVWKTESGSESLWQNPEYIPHVQKYPLDGPSLKGYTFPDPESVIRSFDKAKQERTMKEQRESWFVISNSSFGLFERSWALRGYQNILLDMVSEPEFVHELIERIMEIKKRIVETLVEMPTDAVFFTDDIADQRGVVMGPDLWRTFYKEPTKKLFEKVKRAGKKAIWHICGNPTDIIPDMIGMGCDCLETLQPEAMDIFQVKQQYGKHIVLWGGIGNQSTLPKGTPDDVRNAVKKCIDFMGKGGGYILSASKPLFSDVPVENAATFVETLIQEG